jgi:hypothetical protein
VAAALATSRRSANDALGYGRRNHGVGLGNNGGYLGRSPAGSLRKRSDLLAVLRLALAFWRYPTARLFRQSSPGAWDPVIAEVMGELRTLLTTTGQSQPFP